MKNYQIYKNTIIIWNFISLDKSIEINPELLTDAFHNTFFFTAGTILNDTI
jgi:hypothetical protein